MQNPWRNFPENSPFVLKIDEHFVEQYNANAKPEHKLQTSVMPTPYNGGLDAAKVVFLSLNPGYDILDNFRTEEYRKAIRENLADPYGYDNFVYLDKNFSSLNVNGNIITDPGYEWWKKRTRWLIDRCGEIKGRFMALEWFPYASKEFKKPKEIFPSQRFTFDLVREAIRRGKLIVIFRGRSNWFDSVPGLEKYDNLLKLSSNQNICVSPGNLKDNGFEKIVAAMNSD